MQAIQKKAAKEVNKPTAAELKGLEAKIGRLADVDHSALLIYLVKEFGYGLAPRNKEDVAIDIKIGDFTAHQQQRLIDFVNAQMKAVDQDRSRQKKTASKIASGKMKTKARNRLKSDPRPNHKYR